MQDNGKQRARRGRAAAAGLVLAAAVAVGALAGPAAAFEPSETVALAPAAGSKAKGTAMVMAAGNGTSVMLDLTGLAPKTKVVALFKAGTCARQSASFGTIAQGAADAKGAFKASGKVLYRNAPVSFTVAGDGGHLVVILAGGKMAACGVIPGMS